MWRWRWLWLEEKNDEMVIVEYFWYCGYICEISWSVSSMKFYWLSMVLPVAHLQLATIYHLISDIYYSGNRVVASICYLQYLWLITNNIHCGTLQITSLIVSGTYITG